MTASPSGHPLRVGIIGLGRAGWDIHVRLLRNDPRFTIAAAVDPQPSRRAQARAELACTVFASPQAMLNREDLDLVVVASPSICHKAHSLMALEAGHHVVVEKPLATSSDEVDEMIQASGAAGRSLLPYQPRRLTPLHRRLKQALSDGDLGRVIHVAYRRYNYIRRDDWQCVLANGGGLLSNHGSHVLDQICDLLGSPIDRVTCRLDQISSAGDAEDHVTMLLQAVSGVTVHVEISDGAATIESGPEWTVIGEYGALIASGASGAIRFFNPASVPPRRLQRGLAAHGRRYGTAENLPWEHKRFSLEDVPDASYYDYVHATITRGEPFVFPPDQVREVIALLDVCRSQNPRFIRPSTPADQPAVSVHLKPSRMHVDQEPVRP